MKTTTPKKSSTNTEVTAAHPTNMLKPFMASLDKLQIQYTWDPDWEDEGVLIIDSEEHRGKTHQVGFIMHKDTGELRDIQFGECYTGDEDFEASAKRKADIELNEAAPSWIDKLMSRLYSEDELGDPGDTIMQLMSAVRELQKKLETKEASRKEVPQ